MSRHSARIMRLIAGPLFALWAVIFVAAFVSDLPLIVKLAFALPAAGAAVALLRATHVETELNQDGKQ